MPTIFRDMIIGGLRGCALIVLGCWALAAAAETPRAVTLAPHLTELAFAAGGGDAVVGVVDYSDYPDQARSLPLIGDAFRLDLETIVELDPDLALAWRGGTPEAAAESLESLEVDVVWIETRSLDDIGRALKRIGETLGSPDQGVAAAREFESRLEKISDPSSADAAPVTIFYQVSARPLYTLGGRHVINEVFERCGAVNLFAELDTEAGVVDTEAVIAREPDLIIATREQDTGDPPLDHWRDTSLVESGDTRLHTVDPDLLVRPTPRIIEGIEHICTLVDDQKGASE